MSLWLEVVTRGVNLEVMDHEDRADQILVQIKVNSNEANLTLGAVKKKKNSSIWYIIV